MELLEEFAKGASFGLGVHLTSNLKPLRTPITFFSNWKQEHELYGS